VKQDINIKSRSLSGIILHLHPKYISEDALAIDRTFGLGGMAALLIVIQIITGIMLRFYYEPFPHKAYESIVFLQNSVLFGQLIRNIHHWCGVFAVVITFMHLLRVFFTGGYRASRKLNWLIGLALFILVIFSNFTGYLLPWDQLAYWAVTVGTSLLNYIPLTGSGLRKIIIGGEEVNTNTLIIFFNFHTAVLPVILVILSVYHFWLVRKAGGITLPVTNESREQVSTYPNLVYREFIAALALIAVIMVFSVFMNAPLLGKANPEYSLNPTKAPWYFAGIQELLMHFHPFVAAFLIPLAIIIMLAWLPYLKLREEPSGIWFHSDNGKRSARFSAIASAVITIMFVIVNEFIPKFETLMPWMNSFVSNGIIPLLIAVLIIWLFNKYTVKKFMLNFTETIQVLFVFITTAFIVLTLTGIFFRGADMALTFPWNL
jgi:quinol-cytochrome oxidoreductase complex cytochrome b subunit